MSKFYEDDDGIIRVQPDSKPEKQNNDTANSNLGAETRIEPDQLKGLNLKERVNE